MTLSATFAMEKVLQANWSAPAQVKTLITTRHSYSTNQAQNEMAARAHQNESTTAFGFNIAVHVGDDPAQVLQRRFVLEQHIQTDIVWLEQVHGVAILNRDLLSAADLLQHKQQGLHYDACFSFGKKHACAISTADCVPLLLTDTEGNFVAAIHAGWKGLYGDIIAKTILALMDYGQQLGVDIKPGQMQAWLGPAIGQKHYQVDAEFYQRFVSKNVDFKAAFNSSSSSEKPAKFQANLLAIAKMQLQAEGVIDITDSAICTYDDTHFYSYRREKDCGRFVSMIWLESQ